MALRNTKDIMAQTTEITMPCRLGFHMRVAATYIYFAK